LDCGAAGLQLSCHKLAISQAKKGLKRPDHANALKSKKRPQWVKDKIRKTNLGKIRTVRDKKAIRRHVGFLS
jgi:hypothetical protein